VTEIDVVVTPEVLPTLIRQHGAITIYRDLAAVRIRRLGQAIGLLGQEAEQQLAQTLADLATARLAAGVADRESWIPVADAYARYLLVTTVDVDDLVPALRPAGILAATGLGGRTWWRLGSRDRHAAVGHLMRDVVANPASPLATAMHTAVLRLRGDADIADDIGVEWLAAYERSPAMLSHPLAVRLPVAAGWFDVRLMPALVAALAPEHDGDQLSGILEHLAEMVTRHGGGDAMLLERAMRLTSHPEAQVAAAADRVVGLLAKNGINRPDSR
jgi:hypothetical protein